MQFQDSSPAKLKSGFQIRVFLLISLLISGLLLLGLNANEASASDLYLTTESNPTPYQTSLPDLTVSSLTLSSDTPSRGDAVTVRVTVKNLGSEKARSVHIYFYVEGSLLFSKVINEVEANASAVTDFIWNARFGTHLLKIIIDEDDWIEELNETNNSKSTLVTTVIPDITIESVSWSPTSPKYGENTTFTVTVKNRGEGRSGGVFVLPVLNDNTLDTIFFGPLEPGAQKTLKFSHVMTDEGKQMIRLIADPHKSVRESNEYNNEVLAEIPPIMADLIIENVTWTPVNPDVGEPVKFSIRIKNQGRAPSNPTRFHYYIGAVASGFGALGELAAGATVTEFFTWEAETGKHPASVIIDPIYNVEELNEDNNKREFIFSGTKAADLVIESVSWSPSEPAEGSEITFSVKIKNQGSGPSEVSEIGLYLNDLLYGSSGLDTLTAGASQTGNFTWTVQKGRFHLRAVADLKNTVMENVENNNTLDSVFVFPIPPDITIESIGWSPMNPVTDQEMTFSVILRNEGINKSPGFTVGIYIDGAYLGFVTVDGLGAGVTGKNNGTFKWTAVTGNHAIRVVIDPAGRLLETNTLNNEQVMTFSVAAPSSGSSSVVISTTDNTTSVDLTTDNVSENLSTDNVSEDSQSADVTQPTENASVASSTVIADEETPGETAATEEEEVTTEPAAVEEEPESSSSATRDNRGGLTDRPWVVYVFGASGVTLILILLFDFLRRKKLSLRPQR